MVPIKLVYYPWTETEIQAVSSLITFQRHISQVLEKDIPGSQCCQNLV